MSSPGDPGYRPTQWGTAADHDKRIRILEALVASGAGCGLPCPPWTVDYDTGEVVGTTLGTDAGYPAPLTLTLADPGQSLYNPEGLLRLSIDADEGSTLLAVKTTINASAFGSTIDGEVMEINAISGETIRGHTTTITTGDTATVDGDVINVTGGVASTVRGVHITADGETVTGLLVDATGTGTVLAARFNGDVRINGDMTNGVSVLRTLAVSLSPGQNFHVFDSSFNPIFEVRENGSVHILTGTTVIADL